MSVQLPYGLLPSGKLLHISLATRGAACGCACPQCGKPLIAKQGESGDQEWHFAHVADADCAGALEKMLHVLAKEKIQQTLSVWLPQLVAEAAGKNQVLERPTLFHADAVDLEENARLPFANTFIQPDAVMRKGEAALAIEVFVTHKDQGKPRIYAAIGVAAIEIDLSKHYRKHGDIKGDPDFLPDLVLRSAPRHWLFSPRQAAAEAKMREERARQIEAEEHQAEAERKRIAMAMTEEQRQRLEQKQKLDELEAERHRRLDEERAVAQALRETAEAERQKAIAAYKAAERALANQWTSKPSEWAFGINILARDHLITSDAERWMKRNLHPLSLAGTEAGPPGSVTTIPNAATIDALYEKLWTEIQRERRWKGPT